MAEKRRGSGGGVATAATALGAAGGAAAGGVPAGRREIKVWKDTLEEAKRHPILKAVVERGMDKKKARQELQKSVLRKAKGPARRGAAVGAILGASLGGGYMLGKNAAAYKLQGRMKFQDLSISIENAKGSVRRWKDPWGRESGSTKMHFAYGYIRGTKGTDGDHVDVYIGPDPDAKMAYVIDQNKKLPPLHSHRFGGKLVSGATDERSHTHDVPGGGKTGPAIGPKGPGHIHAVGEQQTGPGLKVTDDRKWTEFDEQKVMLGFPNAKAAKDAYLKQYDDPRFFRSLRAMTMEDFKAKVLDKSNHGQKVAVFLDDPNDPRHIPPTERRKKAGLRAKVDYARKVAAYEKKASILDETPEAVRKRLEREWKKTREGASRAIGKIQVPIDRGKLRTPISSGGVSKGKVLLGSAATLAALGGGTKLYLDRKKERAAKKRLTKKAAFAYQGEFLDPIAHAEYQGIKLAQEYWDTKTEMEKQAIARILARGAGAAVRGAARGGQAARGAAQAVKGAVTRGGQRAAAGGGQLVAKGREAVQAGVQRVRGAAQRAGAGVESAYLQGRHGMSPAAAKVVQAEKAGVRAADRAAAAGAKAPAGAAGPFRAPGKVAPAAAAAAPAAAGGVAPAAAGGRLITPGRVMGGLALAGTGAALYGGMKATDAVANLTARPQSAQYVAAPVPGIGRPY